MDPMQRFMGQHLCEGAQRDAATLAVSQKILATDYDMIERLMARLSVVGLCRLPTIISVGIMGRWRRRCRNRSPKSIRPATCAGQLRR